MPGERGLQTTEGETITTKIVEKVSMLEGVDPVDLHPPLQTVVDLDALESVFLPAGADGPRSDVSVEFTYLDYKVSVESDGELYVRVTQ